MQATATVNMKNQKRNRWIIGGIIVAFLIIGALLVSSFLSNTRERQETRQAQTGEIATAIIGDLAASATASGQVESHQQTSLSVDRSGYVESIFVRAGDSVQAGDVLVQLDTSDLLLRLERAQQNVTLSQANLDALMNGSREVDIAAAEAAVTSARLNLEELLAGPDEYAIAESEASIRAQEANVASAAASYNSTIESITDSAIATARLELLNAQKVYDDAKEVNDNFANADTHDALEEAATDLAVAQLALDDLLDGPSQGNLNSASSSISAAAATLAQNKINHEELLAGSTAVQIAAGEASLAQAEANLANLLSPSTAEDIVIAEAELAQAKLALADSEEALANASITAPFDGIVTTVHVTEGEYATGAVVEMISDDLRVVLSVDEIDVGVLAVGQTAVVTLETWPNEDIVGEITSIAPSANNNDSIVTYDVNLSLEKTELPILVGMTANARLITANKSNVLLLPNAAITADRVNNTYYVNLKVDNDSDQPAYEKVEVTIGLRDDGFTQITSGISEGDQVMIGELSAPTFQFNGPFGGGGD